ncbi:MAG: glycoside hydrolase family 31 protein [Chloroflexota bacterium]|nr:glycoside hydrolase family 31 protein [Chloroflexota bacterium]
MQVFRQRDNTLIWRMGYETVQVEPWGRDSLRVRATMGAEIRDDLPGALLEPAATDAQIEIGEEHAVLHNGAITAELSFKPGPLIAAPEGKLRFLNTATGTELLAEEPQRFEGPSARCFKPLSSDLYRVEARFKAYEGERLYGLGQRQHGRLDQKGCVIELLQRNTEVNIPFLLSSRGYGFLWNNPAVGRVELAHNGTCWVAEAARQMDYWVTVGDTPAEIMEHYADATGHAPMLPEWAAGFWQCKLRYRTQEELLDVAREYKRRGLPLSVIVVDFFHWTLQGDWKFDPECWPDPAGMVRELREMGVRVMVSIWPTVNALSPNFEGMQRRGLLVRTERGVPAHTSFMDTKPEGPVYMHFYDPTNPEAREFIWERVREGYYKHGIKVWWLDACEPEMRPLDPDNLRYHLGNGQEVTNIYPLLHARAFYEGMRSEGEEEIVSLCRAAWAGSQRYGAAVWSGDIPSTFEALQAQVRAGLNIGLSGIPWWTTDIGGFYGGDPSASYFRELIVRWFQYGAFCPLFRLHGFRLPVSQMTGQMTGGPNEVWSFGDEAYEIIKELLFLRERLRPYVMEQMSLAHEKGIPPMRPLFFDFPEDEGCFAVDDQFMFGPDLLVAPILYEDARSREVYLPAGATWRDAWTDETYDGGQRIEADAPLERIPLYLRGEAVLPIRSDES